MGLRGKAVVAGAVAVFAATGGHAAAGRILAASGGTKGCAQLEWLWKQAGGDPGEAFTAAEIAMAESGGNQYATDYDSNGTVDRGYFQINSINGSLSTFSAYGNARAAVIISHDGTDWYPWVTYQTNAYQGKC